MIKITALVENTSRCELKPVHGLSLYIETDAHKILFDLGPDETLFENSRLRGIDLRAVDTVILSHGHSDHGGALERFLEWNTTAKVYAQRRAFEKHSAKLAFFKADVGLNSTLAGHSRVVLLDGDFVLDGELSLFCVEAGERCRSTANDTLYGPDGRDDFSHEQNLLIRGESNVLILGCGHKGIVNIMGKAAAYNPKVCVGGYHLFNPLTKKTVPTALLDQIAEELSRYGEVRFYTCHCTGEKAFAYLGSRLRNLSYLSCGETIEV